jgi:phytoene/squalene synthetase
MDERFAEIMGSLREGQRALDQELYPLLQEQNPDWSMLERLRDVADEYARRARHLREMLTAREAEAGPLEEADQLCRYFDTTASLIAQETGDADDTSSPTDEGRGKG